jgi:alkylhydroperoxidase family enzyme
MARVTLIEEDAHPELAQLIQKIKGARGGTLLNVYKLLLHSPVLAEAWLDFAGVVRWKAATPGLLRELLIIRVGLLNRTDYVVQQHAPRYALEEGVSQAQIDALGDWRGSSLFDAPQRAALAYADAMTQQVQVPDAVFAELRRHYSESQVVELTVLVGAYNALTRILSALEIDPQPPE